MGGKGRKSVKKRKERKQKGKKEIDLMNATNRKIVGLFLSLALNVMINDSTRER